MRYIYIMCKGNPINKVEIEAKTRISADRYFYGLTKLALEDIVEVIVMK